MNDLEKRCIDISLRRRLSHLSSVLNCVNPIRDIYSRKRAEDVFVLGNSHAALALWVVLENRGLCDAEQMSERYGTHAERDTEHGVWVSGGSLGQPETVAVGMALADSSRTVYLLTSDGACSEGAFWESIGIARRLGARNLELTVVLNGWGAYGPIDGNDLMARVWTFFPTAKAVWVDEMRYPPWMRGTHGHYVVLTEKQAAELAL